MRIMLGYSKTRKKHEISLWLFIHIFIGLVGKMQFYEMCSEAVLETEERPNVTCSYDCFEPHKRVLLCKKNEESPTPIECKTSSDCPTKRCELAKCRYNKCFDRNTNRTIPKDHHTGLRLCVQLDEKRYNQRDDLKWVRPKERPDYNGYFSSGKDSQTSVILTGAIVGGVLVIIILCLVGKQKYNSRGLHCAIPPSALFEEHDLAHRSSRDSDVHLDILVPGTPTPVPSPSMDAPPHYSSVVNNAIYALPPTYEEAVILKKQLLEIDTDTCLILEENAEPKSSDKLL